METLVSILRAAHCKSTHHYFAIDALNETQSPEGKALGQMLLANYAEYLKGAKDPDNVFKDFENHVLHVSDGYWGGAAKTSEKWLDTCLQHLSAGKWKEAAYAIGVLSHYFSDPFMPLHTAQSPRETVVHRPLEWSVCCSYDEIFEIAYADTQLASFELQTRGDWMKDAVLRGATMSNKDYEGLIDDYDMRLAKSPKLALGVASKKMLAKIFVWVLTGWGQALDNIANDSGARIPEMPLTLPTLLASIQVPMKKLVAKIESADQRREVELVVDEYNRTGKVVRNLAPEQKKVRKVRETNPELRPEAADIQRIPKTDLNRAIELPESDLPKKPAPIASKTKAVADQTRTSKVAMNQDDLAASVSKPPARPSPSPAKMRSNESESDVGAAPQRKRPRLDPHSPIVDAPAIGPKTAARLIDVGYETVEDLIQGDPEEISRLVAAKWITPKLVEQWQDQARLACSIERLPAMGAGLLVLAGIRSVAELVRHDPEEALEKLREAAATAEGQRLLREQSPPPLKTVQAWIDSARQARKAA